MSLSTSIANDQNWALYRGHGGWGRACYRPVHHRPIQQCPSLALGTNLVDSIVRGTLLYCNTKQLKNQWCSLLGHGLHWCVHDWKPKRMRDHQQEPINFLHWTVEEFDQSRAQATLQAATGFDTDFLCLVNINTVLKLPWKEGTQRPSIKRCNGHSSLPHVGP